MHFVRVLYISIWKNWILHKRHFIITGIEILTPILISIIMVQVFMGRREYPEANVFKDCKQITYERMEPARRLSQRVFYQDFHPYPYDEIYFAPATSTVWNLMKRTFSDTILKPVGFDSERAIVEDAKKTQNRRLWGAVIFSNVSGDGVPSVLKYKLRPNGGFIKNIGKSYYEGDTTRRQHDYFSNEHLSLLGIQTLIDLKYIELRQQQNQTEEVDIKVYFQKMPYPPYKELWSLIQYDLLFLVLGSGFLVPCAIIVKRLVDEKKNIAKEMMKMMGMSTPGYWAGVFMSNFLAMLIITVIISILFVIPFSSGHSVLQDTSFLLFFTLLLLFCTSSLLFSCVISTLAIKASTVITLLTGSWIISTVYSTFFLIDLKLAYLGKVFICLIPNMAFVLAGVIMRINETSGQSAQWSNIFEPPYGSKDSFCLATVLGMMFCSCLLYTALLLYLDTVWPWQPGVPKSPLLCFSPSSWCHSKNTKSEEKCGLLEEENSEYFEEEPSHSPPSVMISNISKVFTMEKVDNIAVNDLSLNLYPGQITALLGHNGAGKTTTMNILTGVCPPTGGSVSISGHDILTDTKAARSNLGLCPQDNVLYDCLTVEEHLRLFATLKGMLWPEMEEEIPKMIEELQLEDQKHTQAKSLTRGMKKKLSFGIAIIGGSKILILDEPTTGIDPECSRVIWDVLKRLRPYRTVLLTTQNMEEAYTLCDRIAVMASGTIQCCGSPTFLKRKFGACHNLRIRKDNKCDVYHITNLVNSHVPEAKLLNDDSLELMFSLSNTSEQFSALFQDLEKNCKTLGIESCGITVTTMDDVLLKIAEMIAEQYQSKEDHCLASSVYETESMHLAGTSKPTLLQQIKALFKKRACYAKHHLSSLILEILLPTIAVIFYLFVNLVPTEQQRDSVVLDLDGLFKENKVGFYHAVNNSTKSGSLVQYYKNTLEKEHVKVLEIDTNVDPNAYLVEEGRKEFDSYLREYLVGGSINSLGTELWLTAWYNGIHFNLDPISINLMTTSLLRYVTGDISENIDATMQPINKETEHEYSQQSSAVGKMLSAVFIVIGVTFLTARFELLPIHERVTKAKLLQRICGVNAAVYWLMHFSWDYLVYVCSSLLLLIPFIVYHGINGFVATEAIGAIFLCLLLFGLSSTILSYLASFIPKDSPSGFSVLGSVNVLSGVVITIVMITLAFVLPSTDEVETAMWFMRLFPTFAVTWGINVIHTNSERNIECLSYDKDDLYQKCNTTEINRHHCCTGQVREGKGYQPLSYLSWDNGAAKECLFLFLTFLLWSSILILIESALPKICFTIMQKITRKTRTDEKGMKLAFVWNEDSDVSTERGRTEQICYKKAITSEALVVRNLTKTFGTLYAVNNLTFSVHEKECFGLLGMNGAGKSTTLRMLAGDLPPTIGDAYIDTFSLQKSLHKFQMSLGYCPQSDALVEGMTARETLELFARLRGIPEKEVNFNVNQIISMFDLHAYADKLTRSYGEGTKRKLSLAIALIGAPPVVLLDDTTSGLDPIARRKIWRTLSFMKQTLGVSFILTSHSMEECEILCNRIAIMVNGEFKCLGTLQSLEKKFAQGYSLAIKIKEEAFLDTSQLAEIRSYIERQFPSASLITEYQGNLHYHITDTSMKWSTMFAAMEETKSKFQLEDYSLSETTLQQMFRAFARSQAGKARNTFLGSCTFGNDICSKMVQFRMYIMKKIKL